jgi:hypothetical protein
MKQLSFLKSSYIYYLSVNRNIYIENNGKKKTE